MFWKTTQKKEKNNYQLERLSPLGLIIVHILFVLYYILFLYVGETVGEKVSRFQLIFFTFFPMLFLYFYSVQIFSKEVLILKEDIITIKKYCFLFCYTQNIFSIENVKSLCYESKQHFFSYNNLNVYRNWNFCVKISPYEDTIYSFGRKMKKGENQDFFEFLRFRIQKQVE